MNKPQFLTELRRQLWRGVVLAVLCSIAANVLILASPLYTLQVFDRVLHSGSLDTLIVLTVALLISLIGFGLFDALRGRMLVHAGEWVEEVTVPRVARLGHDMAGPGPASDVKMVRGFVSGPYAAALFDLPWAPLFIAVCFVIHWMVGLLAAGAAVILLIVAFLNDRVSTRSAQDTQGVQNQVVSRLSEVIRARFTLNSMAMTGTLIDQAAKKNGESFEAQRAGELFNASAAGFSKTIRYAAQSLVMGLGAWLSLKGEMSGGAMIAASIVMGRALQPVDQAINACRGLMQAREAWTRIGAVLSRAENDVQTIELPEPQGGLFLSGVGFETQSGQKILADISLRIEPGQVLGVVGPSGSGKSTLARLMTGGLAPTSGEIRLGASELAHYPEEQRGRLVGYVPQDSTLLSGTVKDNIARFQSYSDERIAESAAYAGCHNMIAALSEGYGMVLGEGGAPLSGGQKQRIALARALVSQPRLLVLDEPNAHQDHLGENALRMAIGFARARKAAVVLISHKAALMSEADNVVMLLDGKVNMQGPRESVMAMLTGRPQSHGTINGADGQQQSGPQQPGQQQPMGIPLSHLHRQSG